MTIKWLQGTKKRKAIIKRKNKKNKREWERKEKGKE